MNQIEQSDPEEAELVASYEAGEWRSVNNLREETDRYQEYARSTFKKVNASTCRNHLE